MKILVFSSLNIDHDYQLSHICQPKETIFANQYQVVAGGKGLNAAIAIARTSSEVFLAGNIGNDATILSNLLDTNHVNTSLLNHVDEPNGHAIIQIDEKGENAIFIYGGSNQSISTQYVDKVIENFETGDIIILQNEINNIAYIMQKAHDKGLKIVFNPSPINNELFSYPLDYVDYFFINEVEGQALSDKTDFKEILDELIKRYPTSQIIMTVGANGSYYRSSNNEIYQPAFPTKVVSTVSAGDTYLGYFVYGLTIKLSIEKCLTLASQASSMTVSRLGAADSIPTLVEVNDKFTIR